MIKVICGLIGAGKTTYVINNKKADEIILDWDIIKEMLNTDSGHIIKDIQIEMLKLFIKEYKINVWYVTTLPTIRELEILDSIDDIEYYWINTLSRQCINNIVKRNRGTEREHINNFMYINNEIKKRYDNSNINFKIIDVFDSEERW